MGLDRRESDICCRRHLGLGQPTIMVLPGEVQTGGGEPHKMDARPHGRVTCLLGKIAGAPPHAIRTVERRREPRHELRRSHGWRGQPAVSVERLIGGSLSLFRIVDTVSVPPCGGWSFGVIAAPRGTACTPRTPVGGKTSTACRRPENQ